MHVSFAELFTIDGLDDDYGSYHSSSEDEDDVPNGEISCVFTFLVLWGLH